MAAAPAKIREWERKFAHLKRRELGESVVYRSPEGRELFRLEGGGNRIRLPVSLELLRSLFGDLPFPVRPFGDNCVVRLDQVEDLTVLWNLIEALGEQSTEPSEESLPFEERQGDPVERIHQSINSIQPIPHLLRGNRPGHGPTLRPARRVRFQARIVMAGVILLVAAFLALSYLLGSRSARSERANSVEELLYR